jgi:hypothetical protein
MTVLVFEMIYENSSSPLLVYIIFSIYEVFLFIKQPSFSLLTCRCLFTLVSSPLFLIIRINVLRENYLQLSNRMTFKKDQGRSRP